VKELGSSLALMKIAVLVPGVLTRFVVGLKVCENETPLGVFDRLPVLKVRHRTKIFSRSRF
jgi:hypothetical protein